MIEFEEATLAQNCGRLEDAEAGWRRALDRNPSSAEANYGLATTLLALGRYEEGWPLYEARHFVPRFNNPLPSLPLPRWRGEPLRGKRLLVWPEQGFGDKIMFARFLRRGVDDGGQAVFLSPPALVGLLSSLPIQVHPRDQSVDLGSVDCWTMLGGLARYFARSASDVTGAPYLTAEGDAKWGGIGMKLRGVSADTRDAFRRLPAALADRLLRLPGARSLEPEDTGAANFLDTANIIQGLDVVLTVDTSVAHLAGALGKRTILMLPPRGIEWRWSCARARWYDSIELIKAPTWPEIVEAAVARV